MHVGVGKENHVSAHAAIAAVGSAVEHKFFPVEGNAAVSPVSGLGRNFYMIHKISHGFLLNI